MRSALFVTAKLPHPLDEGGRIAAWNLARCLRHNGYELDLACFVASPQLVVRHGVELRPVFRSITTTTRDVRRQYPLHLVRALLSGGSYFVHKFSSHRLERQIEALLAVHDYDLTVIESVFSAVYLPTIRGHSTSGHLVLRLQNVEYEILERLAERETRPLLRTLLAREARKFRRFELEAVRSVGDVRAISARDAKLLSQQSGKPVGVLDALIDTDLYGPGSPDEIERYSILSIGDHTWLPNRNGVRWFHAHVWPAVAERFPEARWYIVGHNPPPSLRHLADDRIVVTGRVEDDAAYFRRAHVFAVPLLEGSGVRIKILLALAMGKTVLATPVGAEGIGFAGLRIHDSAAGWQSEIERAFATSPSIDSGAIDYARSRHHWRRPFELESADSA